MERTSQLGRDWLSVAIWAVLGGGCGLAQSPPTSPSEVRSSTAAEIVWRRLLRCKRLAPAPLRVLLWHAAIPTREITLERSMPLRHIARQFPPM